MRDDAIPGVVMFVIALLALLLFVKVQESEIKDLQRRVGQLEQTK